MQGKVNGRIEAILKLRLRSLRQTRRTVTAVVDTGYSGMLTLPNAAIKALRLQRVAQSAAKLADGSVVTFDVFLALLEWDGKTIPIYVDQAEADPLVGMHLLLGHDLAIRVKKNGAVTITRF